MGAVNISIGHQDNAVVAQPGRVELIVQASAQRRDDGADFLVGKHLVRGGLFHIEDFATQG